jgi:molecular chaperone DnaK
MRVGIDLGTTYSLIARMGSHGTPLLLPDHVEQDVFHTPSVVGITNRSALVGRMAEHILEVDPEFKVLRFFKRQFGEERPIYFDDQRTAWSAEAIGALMLRKLRYDAESFASSQVESAVITVPAHFSDPQRKAVLAAAMMADIPVLGLVDEPVAAALHYGVKHASHDQVLLVYDWGGGTFDTTVLSLDERGVYVLAKAGATDLGGKELDEAVAQLILEQFESALGAMPPLGARTLLDLRRISEEVKVELSTPQGRRVARTVLLGGHAVDVDIRRDAFEARIADLLDRTEALTLQSISDAGLRESDIDVVLMVGGSSMVPAVVDRLRARFTGLADRVVFHEPTKAVAFGAAIHASQLSGDAERYHVPPEFRGVTGHSVGVRAVDAQTGRVSIDTVIKQNMPLPVRVSKTYFTTHANQQRIVLDLVQFRSKDGPLIPLGQLVVGPLPSPRQNYPIEVTLESREDGTIAVQAYDAQTGVELAREFGRDAEQGFAYLATQRALVRSTPINTM